MDKKTLKNELRMSIISKRLLEVVIIGAVEVGNDLVILKQRANYDFKEEEAIYYSEKHDLNYGYKELIAKVVIYDHSLFKLKGRAAIKEYLDKN
ncbi:hypothetical protein [Shouchella patagoniensis]|uniref:hypothetical protein n=1 Tax=Shouchella patagoniensis TaxID=228576 RepID=UPI000994A494|nr:hypothetical protein [Shouchella patagoniensis]